MISLNLFFSIYFILFKLQLLL